MDFVTVTGVDLLGVSVGNASSLVIDAAEPARLGAAGEMIFGLVLNILLPVNSELCR